MKILLDECIPRKFKNSLAGHECLTVPEAGLAGKKNATTFTVVSDLEVPSGLAPGAVTISITTPGGTANSPTKFTVN